MEKISDIKILVIDSDQSIAENLLIRLKDLGIGLCSRAVHDTPIGELSTLKPTIAILGPTLDKETIFKCIHKLKIVDPAIPILTSSRECLAPESSGSPFEGIHYFDPEPGIILDTIEASLKHRIRCELMSNPPVIIGQSAAIKGVKERIKKLAGKDITVLITGETGTGKELVARSLHFHSPRSGEPLVKVDCTSLPDELLESEVFGFQKGAFTDAYRDKPGRLELADGGTLFVDEIGEISLSLQVKFMQVFEDKEFSRLGGTEDKVIDARVVVATNANLWEKVREGSFRKDLFYRLNVAQIDVAPLRERKDDIPLLIHYFQNKYCFEYKRELFDIPHEVSKFFLDYNWPGNVRELENVIRRAIAVSDWNFVFEELRKGRIDLENSRGDMPGTDLSVRNMNDDEWLKLFQDNDFSLKKISKAYVAEAEKQAIIKALNETQWNRTKAARLLGVSYKTLINRIDEFEVKP